MLEFLSSLDWWSNGREVVSFLFVLTIVVFFHELGHFWVARRCGVRVEAFSLGFGPELAGFNDRHGTRWKLSAIPLGGYVKFFGDQDESSSPDFKSVHTMSEDEKKSSFFHKSVGKRAAIVAAGPIANFILAIVVFAGIYTISGKPIISPRIETVHEGGAAQKAGLKGGDLILSIDGQDIESFSDIQRIVGVSAGQTLAIEVDRNGSLLTVQAVPDLKEVKDHFGGVHRVGLLGITRQTMGQDITYQRYDVLRALGMGVRETWFIIERTLSYVKGLILGTESPDQLGGPLRIAQVSGHMAGVSFDALINLVAVLSVSIGLLNLFPVPMLDGGHLLFYAYEAVRGKQLPEKAQEIGFRIGLVLVVGLFLFTTKNDIWLRFFQ